MADVTLKIFSHSRSHPLASADYRYDLRNIPNPPREMRRQYDGRAKRLREHLLREPMFSAVLDQATTEIEVACSNAGQISSESPIDPSELQVSEQDSISRTHPEASMDDGTGGEESIESLADDDAADNVDETDVDTNDTNITITVSCFCERGKHRSVAFAEELAKRFGRFYVELEHRDILQKPSKRHRTKDGRGRSGIGFESDED